jgi:hypothetical protein
VIGGVCAVLLYLAHGVELFFNIERALWIAAVLAEALVLVRLFREGLIRRYPFFAAFLMAQVVCSIVLMQTNIRGRDYAEAYRTWNLVTTVFRLGFAAELYERICEHFPGVGRFRVGMAAGFVLLAAFVAVFTFRSNLANQWAFPQTIAWVVLRYQGEIFAGVFLLTWIFLRFVLSIRQPFRPNVLKHWTIATIYFGVIGIGHLVVLLARSESALVAINCVMLAVDLGCFFAWFRLMRRSGEQLPAFRRLSPDQVEAVEHYNRELLETVTSLPGEISARQAENQDTPLHQAR